MTRRENRKYILEEKEETDYENQNMQISKCKTQEDPQDRTRTMSKYDM